MATSLGGFCPVCNRRVRKGFRPGPGGRLAARCPHCRSLERQRFQALLLGLLTGQHGGFDLVVEIAPPRQSELMLHDVNAHRVLRLDIGHDTRTVDALASATHLPLGDACVDLLICSHVLEHVPDDRAAMREFVRVLAPSATALLQVPLHPGMATDEDPEARPDERLRRFGQIDHVRLYGDDFEDRLVEAGLAIDRVTPLSLLGPGAVEWFGLKPHEFVWLARRAHGDPARPEPICLAPKATALTSSLDALLGEFATVHRRAARLRRDRGLQGLRHG